MASQKSSEISLTLTNNQISCIICGKNEFLNFPTTRGRIEIPLNFLDELNLLWPWLKVEKTTSQNEILDCYKDRQFTEVPPICQLCANEFHAMHYFKCHSSRNLEELWQNMEKAKANIEANNTSLFSPKPKDNMTTRNPAETLQKRDITKTTLKTPWKPSFLQKTSPSSALSKEALQIARTTRGILNKLTNNGIKLAILTCKLVTALSFLKDKEENDPESKFIMKIVALVIFNKAVKESFFGPAYVRATHLICKLNSKFRKLILDLCQFQFQRICLRPSDETEDKRRKAFGILSFIQDLYIFKVVSPKIIVMCVESLIQLPVTQYKLDLVHYFLATKKHELNIPFGEIIDVHLNSLTNDVKRGENVNFFAVDGWMDTIFDKLTRFSKNPEISERIRYLLANLVELRGNGWKSRARTRITEVPWGKPVLKPFPPYNEPALVMFLFERQTRSILNKLNLSNVNWDIDNLFKRLFFEFLLSPFWFSDEGKFELQIVKAAEMLFDKGLREPIYCNAYAKMVDIISRYRRKHDYSINFPKIREIVVRRCINEITKITSTAEADVLKRECIFAVIKFIGELYTLNVFSDKNMGTCMQLLINGPVNEQKVECMYRMLMCKFLNTETNEMICYGEFLDKQLVMFRAADKNGEGADWIIGMFSTLKIFAEDARLNTRIRCLLINLMELRGNGWKHKSHAVASIALSNEDSGKKNGGKGGQTQGRGRNNVPHGNWRS